MKNNLHIPSAQKHLLYLVVALLFTAQPIAAKTQQLPPWDTFVSQFIETYFKTHPDFAANAGRHEFDGKLPDWSIAGLTKEKQWLDLQHDLVSQYPESSLKETERFERQYLLAVIDENMFWLHSAQAPFKNPMYYAHSLDPNVYISRPYAPIEQRLKAFIDYAGNIPKATEQIRTNLKLPLPHTYIDVGKKVFGGFAKFYEVDVKANFANVKDEQLQKQFNTVVPIAAKAMRELADWMESQRKTATDDYAMGTPRFQEMLKATEGIDLSLSALEKAGRDDLERNLAALREACSHYAPEPSVQDCVKKAEAKKPPEGAVAAAQRQLITLKAFITEKKLVTIPGSEEAMVAESPPYNRWNSAYIDIPGPYEQGLPSTYYVAPPDPSWSPKEQAAYIPSKGSCGRTPKSVRSELSLLSFSEGDCIGCWDYFLLVRSMCRTASSNVNELPASDA